MEGTTDSETNLPSVFLNRKIKYPNVVEKRKYQTVSEFQFVYPGTPKKTAEAFLKIVLLSPSPKRTALGGLQIQFNGVVTSSHNVPLLSFCCPLTAVDL